MKTFHFSVENTSFVFDENFLTQSEFTVHSVPRNYTVRLEQQVPPAQIINRLLAENPKNLLLIDHHVWDLYGQHITVDPSRVM